MRKTGSWRILVFPLAPVCNVVPRAQAAGSVEQPTQKCHAALYRPLSFCLHLYMFFCAGSVPAQDLTFVKAPLSRNGLGHIVGITQDRQGFLWLAPGPAFNRLQRQRLVARGAVNWRRRVRSKGGLSRTEADAGQAGAAGEAGLAG